MKIDYISDLHINHHVPFTNNQLKWEQRTRQWVRDLVDGSDGDVLVIAGDFSEWNRQTLWVLETVNEMYDQTFIVFGNHDYYLLTKKQVKKYGHSQGRTDEVLAGIKQLDKVTCLHGDTVTFNHVTFAGHGLWYRLDTPQAEAFFKTQSNDSQFIKGLSPWTPVTETLYKEAMNWYKTIEHASIDVMVSHVPPLHPPISDREYNACYVCPVPFLNGKHWIAGHQHLNGTFEEAGTTFHMNALGYPGEHNEQPGLQSFTV